MSVGERLSEEAEARTVDPVELAVVQSALIGIAREMGTIMERASYSSILNEGKDFSCAVFDPSGELVAEGEFVLVHLAAMQEAVKVFIEHFGDRWRPGDIAIHNDPYEGGSHLPDINLLRPVFFDGELIGYVATRAHYPDVGGRVPGSFAGEAQSLFEEGVVIPPLLLAREDSIDDQLIEFWARNVRVSRRLRADLMAQVASVRVGDQRLVELADRVGLDALKRVLLAIPDYGEELMRKRIEQRLTGATELFDFMDDAGPEMLPVLINVAIRTEDGEIEFDYTGSDDQVPCPINAPRAVVKSATYGAMKCLLIPELPLTSGMFRPISVLTRPGSVMEPTAPAPVAAGNTNTSQRILDLCLAGLGEMTDEGTGGMAASYSANSDIGIGGSDSRTGEEFVLYMMPVGGIGARIDQDGESALINYMGNCSSQPAEVFEAMHPFRVGEYRLRPDSAGPGKRRGGLGLSVTFEALDDGLQASIFTERLRFAPFGLRMGQPAESGRYAIRRGDRRYELQTKTSGLRLRKGDVIEVLTPGGGGYGDPWTREVELVEEDLRQGLISVETAEREYGVVVDATGAVDRERTDEQRSSAARPFGTVPIEAVGGDGDSSSPSVELSTAVARDLHVTDRQVLCCFSPTSAVYAAARLTNGDGAAVTVSASVTRALGLGVGDELHLRPLSTHWVPYRSDDVRRTFSSRVADDVEEETR